jgi:hypothetical protein
LFCLSILRNDVEICIKDVINQWAIASPFQISSSWCDTTG